MGRTPNNLLALERDSKRHSRSRSPFVALHRRLTSRADITLVVSLAGLVGCAGTSAGTAAGEGR